MTSQPPKESKDVAKTPSLLGTERIAFWDNTKGLLMFLVMGLHFVGLLPASTLFSGFLGRFLAGSCYPTLIVGVPGFAFISGRFSSAKPGRHQQVRQLRLLGAFVITHLIWMPVLGKPQASYLGLTSVTNPKSVETIPFVWYYGYDWYLLCVVVWRALLPVLAELRLSVHVFSVAVALAALFLDWSAVSNEQLVFTYLPFFLAGFHFKTMDGWLQKWRRRQWLFWVGSTAFATTSAIYLSFGAVLVRVSACLSGGFWRDVEFYILDHPETRLESIYNGSTVLPHATDCQTPTMLVQILGFYVAAAASLALLLAMVPERRVPLLTAAGQNSLYIYILHFYIAWPLALLAPNLNPDIGIALAIFAWSALWAMLAWGRINRVCWLCVEPPVDFITKAEGV